MNMIRMSRWTCLRMKTRKMVNIYKMQLQTKGQILCTCSYGRLYWWGKLGLRFYFFLVSLFFKLKLIKEETVFNLVKRPSESEGNLSSTIAHAVWPELWNLVPRNWYSIRFYMASNGSLAVCAIFCYKWKRQNEAKLQNPSWLVGDAIYIICI